jgi:uncharacterized protein
MSAEAITRSPLPRSRRSWGWLDWLWFVPLIGLLWLGLELPLPGAAEGASARVQGLVAIFLGIFIEAIPFVVAGVLLSSAIALFVSERVIQRVTPRSPVRAALVGASLGLAFPVCECGTVPTTRRLLQKGAPLPFGIAFLLAAPVINPIVLLSTYVAFSGDWLIVGSRAGLTFGIAMVVALVVAWLPRQRALLAAQTQMGAHGDTCGCEHHTHTRSLGGMLGHAAEELIEMSRWLILGALLAATLQTFVPQSALLAVGDGPILSVLVLMLLALVLSVCSTVDAFLALALSTTFGPGALIAFLVFGPMIDIKSTLLFLTTLTPRAVALIIALVTPLVALSGIIINIAVAR